HVFSFVVLFFFFFFFFQAEDGIRDLTVTGVQTCALPIFVVTLSPRSSVVADTRTSQLIVTTTEKEVDNVNALVAKLDTATRQVRSEERRVGKECRYRRAAWQ